MTVSDAGGRVRLYDFYGNPVPAKGGKIAIPLDGRGFFLRGDGRPGSFAALVKAVRESRVEGIEPLATVARDFLAPVGEKPALRLTLTNVLNRPVSGALVVRADGLTLDPPTQRLTFAANETKEITVRVTGGKAAESNAYPLALRFDAGKDGTATHHETLRVNVIARRTVTVDGDLKDWDGALPQTIVAGESAPTVTEAAWYPFKQFDAATGKGVATGYLAYDDQYFYFAAKVADSTPDAGTVRFETRNDDEYFYPAQSYAPRREEAGFGVRWTGHVTPSATGEYTFYTVSDDGIRLWVDDKPVIDNWTDHAATEDRATVRLTAGQRHAIRLEYYQGGGDAVARLLWSAPGKPREVIPASALRADDGKTPGLTAHYFLSRALDKRVAEGTVPAVDFTWNSGAFPDPAYKTAERALETLEWPAGVRRYSYRKDPILPAGNAPNFDNVQIAFNVLPPERKLFDSHPPGTLPGFTTTSDTDYEYALNRVAPAYGGGTEIWRLNAPGMPLKHFYPRQPRSPKDGPVRDGKLAVRQDGGTRIVECAIPWSEIPDVKKRIDAGQTVRFSFRANDDAGVGCLELSRGRSVAKRGGSFHVDWTEHWENQVEFAAEKSPNRAADAKKGKRQ
jgi:hypothetical protein